MPDLGGIVRGVEIPQSSDSAHPAWLAACAHLDPMFRAVADGSADECTVLAFATADLLAAAVALAGLPDAEARHAVGLLERTAVGFAVHRRNLLLARDRDSMAALTAPDDLSGLG